MFFNLRFWDRQNQKMYDFANKKDNVIIIDDCYYYPIITLKGDLELFRADKWDLEILLDINRFLLLKGTGKKDKNNKEIYESDVVKYNIRNIDIFGIVVFYHYDNFIGFGIHQITQTLIEDEKGYLHDASFYDYDGALFVWKDLEIVGNLLENNEWLEKIDLVNLPREIKEYIQKYEGFSVF